MLIFHGCLQSYKTGSNSERDLSTEASRCFEQVAAMLSTNQQPWRVGFNSWRFLVMAYLGLVDTFSWATKVLDGLRNFPWMMDVGAQTNVRLRHRKLWNSKYQKGTTCIWVCDLSVGPPPSNSLTVTFRRSLSNLHLCARWKPQGRGSKKLTPLKLMVFSPILKKGQLGNRYSPNRQKNNMNKNIIWT